MKTHLATPRQAQRKMNNAVVPLFFKTIAAMLAMACAVLFVSACGGGGGGAPAGGGLPQPEPQTRTQNIAPERLQLDGIRAQYPGLAGLEIDQAVVSESPDFPNSAPNDAQKFGEYALENGGRVVVWLVPQSGAQTRAVNTPKGRFLVYALIYVPANMWESVVSTDSAPINLSSPVAITECAAGLVLENGSCVVACEGGAVENNVCKCQPWQTLVDGVCKQTCLLNSIVRDDPATACACPIGTTKADAVDVFGPVQAGHFTCLPKCEDGMVLVNRVCKKPKQCRDGFVYSAEIDECRLSCPEDMDADECERRRWEYEASPASRIAGMDYARELGLTGKGVTIGVGELASPYWKDDCSTFPGYVFIEWDRQPEARPDEEVPARYNNYENGECERGLVRTNSELPTVRVLDGSLPSPSSSVLEKGDGFGDSSVNRRVAHVNSVLGVMAARDDGYGVVGIAPEADYAHAFYPFFMGGGVDTDVEIVNFSISSGPRLSNYEVTDYSDNVLTLATRERILAETNAVDPLLAYLDAVPNPADRRVHVFAAGNEKWSGLPVGAGAPLYFPELRGNHLAVVAVEGGRLASYSNRCGRSGAANCLAAPVEGWLLTPDIREELFQRAYGTSYAAPQVSGALALVKEYFNRMGGIGSHELVQRILQTADKSGIYADESIYGAGVLDLENALTPQGELQLLSGQSVSDSESHSLSQSGLRTGPAFGDSIGKSLEGVQIAAFDTMNAPFPVSAAGLIQSEWESDSLRNALLAFQFGETTAPKSQWNFANGFGWWSLRGGNSAGQPEIESIFGADDVYANPYSALAGDGMSGGLEWDSFRMAMFGETPGQETLARGAVGSFSFAPFSETTESGGWIFHFGGVEEPKGFLSSSGVGAFGDLRSRTAFVGADYVGEKVNGWRIRLGGFAGDTSAEDGEWFAGTESLRSDSFHLGVERENIFHSGDGLGFRLHQPLRASGSLKIRIPTGRTRYGDLTWREVSGKTSGRELALEGLYRRSFDGGSLRVSAGAVSEPGHRAEAKTIGRMLFAFEREF